MIAAARRTASAFDSAVCALASCEPDGTIRQANHLLSSWAGCDAEHLAGLPFARILAPASTLLFELQLRPRLALGQRIDGAFVAIGATGRTAVPAIMNAVQYDDGSFDVALISVREREAFEESLRRAHADAEAARAELADTARALRESEALVRAQFAATPLPTFVWRVDGRGHFMLDGHNAVGEPLLSSAAPVGSLDATTAFGRTRAPAASMAEALASKRVIELELPNAERALGSSRTLLLTIGPLPPDRVVMHVRDVTHERAMEQQQRHGFKMQALGELVAGIAHEFNNVLSVISGNLELMRADLAEVVPAQHTLHTDAATVHTATQRAVSLVAQLLAFAGRPSPQRREVVLVNDVLRESERLLRPLLGAAIHWKLQLDEELPLVLADTDQLAQVITNLVINARDAVKAQGRSGVITLTTSVVQLDDADLRVPAGRYVKLAVHDTGVGMSEEVRSRAFEPFFTTKPVGHGTGLGLSTIYGIVRDLGGITEIESTPGVGTCVWLLLPCHLPEHDA